MFRVRPRCNRHFLPAVPGDLICETTLQSSGFVTSLSPFGARSDNIGSAPTVTLQGLCPLCGVRKAKRDCPALGKRICAVCCATKRLKEINCPDTCVYLTSARSHPPAIVQRRQERDLGFLLPLISDLTEPQASLVLLFRSALLNHAAQAIPAVLDVDVAEAAAAVAATLETARKGVIYQHEPTSIPAQRLATRLQRSCRRAERRSRIQDRPARNRRREGPSRDRARRAGRAGRPGRRRAADLHRRPKEVGGPWTETRKSLPEDEAPDGGPLIVPG